MSKMFLFFLLLPIKLIAQEQFAKNEFSFNFFRNPSIGLEYRHKHISVHTGYYITNFERNTTWKFFKAGVSYWFLPVDKKDIPSAFYFQAALLYGLNRDYKNALSISFDPGFRQMIGKKINLRLGAAFLISKNRRLQVNPTPGIGYFIK